MTDDIATDTKLTRLPPTEKMRDGRGRMSRPGPYRKKREEKRGQISTFDADVEEESASPDSSEERSSGKILDILI